MPIPAQTTMDGRAALEAVRRLPDHPTAVPAVERWQMYSPGTQEDWLLHRVSLPAAWRASRDVIDAARRLLASRGEHLLRPVHAERGEHGTLDLISPYPGDQDGLMTLQTVADAKGGTLPTTEALRATEHVLLGAAEGHASGLAGGPHDPRGVLVDRRGRCLLELYGVRTPAAVDAEATREETRSIVAMGYRLLTGRDAGDEGIAPSRLAAGLGAAWDQWFAAGLDAAQGYSSPTQALAAMPSGRDASEGSVTSGFASGLASGLASGWGDRGRTVFRTLRGGLRQRR